MTNAANSKATETKGMGYEVEKFARGNKGEWFGFGARRFATLDEATAYLERFAAEQADVLGNGVRIDLRTRKGRKILAMAGGERARREIRWLASEES